MLNKTDKTILIVDDDEMIINSMIMFLNSEGYTKIIKFYNGKPALNYIKENSVDLILLDLHLPDTSGLKILTIVNEENPQIPVIIMTGSNDIESVIKVMKSGASDYLVKPINLERASTSITKALDFAELSTSFNNLKKEFFEEKLKTPEVFSSIITTNKKITKLFHYIAAISESTYPVLITGETGVGKELFAKSIHDMSNCTGSFIAMDVSSYNNENFKDALCGHVKGAFTGAALNRNGLIKSAENGTLFLDEIGDLSLELQNILLRIIQENEYRQVGSDKLLKTNAKIIFATHRDLHKLIDEGLFRKDLYYRLETHGFEIPPLRERPDDIFTLFNHFVKMACNDLNKVIDNIPLDVYKSLKAYDFPGNVREIKNIAFNAVTLSQNSELLLEHIISKLRVTKKNPKIEKFIKSNDIIESHSTEFNEVDCDNLIIKTPFPTFNQAETLLIKEAMKRSNNNQLHASELLGISRQALNRRLNKSKT
ncbi:MAG: sigma-54 dependent transcriptional regulator [Spirochaetaceae bacterium]